MRLVPETEQSASSLRELYHELSDVWHNETLYTEHIFDFLWATGITVLILFGAALAIVHYRKRSQLQHRASDTKEPITEEDVSFAPLGAGVLVFLATLFIVNVVHPPTNDVEHHTVQRATELSETVQETVQKHLREEYRIAEVQGVKEPDASYRTPEASTYRDTMHTWVQNFYQTPTKTLEVNVTLEDEPHSIYTYQLWYDHTADRARLMDTSPEESTDNTAPEVESITRGGNHD